MPLDTTLIDSLTRLKRYCEGQNYKGWDPYDGLNSKIFNAIPGLKSWPLARLAWIQAFKRSPINLRPLLLVPKMQNAKGIGLFLQGYCNLYHAVGIDQSLQSPFGTQAQIKERIVELADTLVQTACATTSGAAWGYNFPWQCRLEFLFPAYEPTVVATCFCATALFEAYEITGRREYLETALSSARFVLDDLHRTPTGSGFLFSYSRLPGNDTIYNASLLGSRLLSYCYKYNGDKTLLDAAAASVRACCEAQQSDGSWAYGVKAVTGWKDSFHTGYNLDGLSAYRDISGDHSVDKYIDKGLEYYINNFFTADGEPKYYNDRQYPIDIHCPGQLPVTLSRLGRYGRHAEKTRKVMRWAIDNMQHPKGYFYYQKKKSMSSRIPYMRWSNAFMFASLSYMVLAEAELARSGDKK